MIPRFFLLLFFLMSLTFCMIIWIEVWQKRYRYWIVAFGLFWWFFFQLDSLCFGVLRLFWGFGFCYKNHWCFVLYFMNEGTDGLKHLAWFRLWFHLGIGLLLGFGFHFSWITVPWVFILSLYGFFMQVKKKINLVYGGGSVGLMGLISQTVHDGGCHVLG